MPATFSALDASAVVAASVSATFRQHVTSARNVELVAALTAAGRMRDRGRLEVDRARADGRRDRAYAGAVTIGVPTDFLEALQASPMAVASFRA
jgi:uncharacterized protein YdeI (YjbR/CyaY-like superfamily)